MTTPDERMRSLRWAWELLSAIQQDPSMPPSLVDQARLLAPSFPTPEALMRLVESDARELPTGFADAIDEARALFERVQFDGHGTDETKRHLLFTLRHFPLKGEARRAVHGTPFGGIERWLAPETR